MLKSLAGVGSRAASVASRPQGAVWPSARLSLTPCSRHVAAMSSSSGPGSVHSHSGTSVPADADVKAAQEGEPQFHGSGEPLDVGKGGKADPVHSHSGRSVPQDTDVKAAQKGEPQFEGSGQPLDVNSVQTELPPSDGESGKV